MGEYGVPENEMEGKSHWEHGFDNLPGDPMNLFDPSLLSDLSNPYPDSYCLSIGDIEHLWMEDDNEDGLGEKAVVEPHSNGPTISLWSPIPRMKAFIFRTVARTRMPLLPPKRSTTGWMSSRRRRTTGRVSIPLARNVK
ncbi:Pinin like, partial [Actinidia chinensis var. chinensis]